MLHVDNTIGRAKPAALGESRTKERGHESINGAWAGASANLTPFAGQTIRLLIEAADASTASLVEAGIDDVRITRQ